MVRGHQSDLPSGTQEPSELRSLNSEGGQLPDKEQSNMVGEDAHRQGNPGSGAQEGPDSGRKSTSPVPPVPDKSPASRNLPQDGGAESPYRLSHATYAIPFGHYQGTRKAEHPAQELLVGREGQRAYFLNLLFSLGRKGAFLVTGHRGSGKSTFVRYCLEEYCRNIFGRFLQSNVGRTLFWDRLVQLGFAALAIYFLLLLSELLYVLASHKDSQLGLRVHESLVVLLICMGFFLVPFLEAWEILRLFWRPWIPRIQRGWLWVQNQVPVGRRPQAHEPKNRAFYLKRAKGGYVGLPALALFGVIGYLGWTRMPLASPPITVTWLVSLVGSTYLSIAMASITRYSESSKRTLDQDPSYLNRDSVPSRRLRRLIFRLIVPGLVVSILVWTLFLPLWPRVEGDPPPLFPEIGFFASTEHDVAVFQAILGILLASLGAAVRAADQSLLERRIRSDASGLRLTSWERTSSALRSSRWWYSVAATSGIALCWAIPKTIEKLYGDKEFLLVRLFYLEGGLWLLISAILGAWILSRGWVSSGSEPIWKIRSSRDWSKSSPPLLIPRPLTVLVLKAFCLIVIGLQLVYPASELLPDQFLEASPLGMHDASSLGMFSLARLRLGEGVTPLFSDPGDELYWVLGSLLLLLGIVALEYELIVRPRQAMREDIAIHDRTDRRREAGQRQEGFDQQQEQEELQQTYFWRVTNAWLPVLTVPVNLGVDRLEYRRVIEAMLMGLREKYRRFFLNWGSHFTAVRRLLFLGLVVIATIILGDGWFGIRQYEEGRPTPLYNAFEEREFCRKVGFNGQNGGGSLGGASYESTTAALWLVCAVAGEPGLQALQWCPMHVVRRPMEVPEAGAPEWFVRAFPLWLVVRQMLGGSTPGADEKALTLEKILAVNDLRSDPLEFRVYHVMVFFTLLAGLSFLTRRLGVLPYRQMDRRMGVLLDNLTSKVLEEDRPEGYLPDWIGRWTLRARVFRKEGGPYDPRTVELTFLRILADIQDPAVQIPLATGQRISPPIPEIIFVFDELDKVGVRSLAYEEEGEEGPAQASEPLDEERARSRELHRLFADLKNILSSGEARFIFIGGRNLHDEWLADQSARYPLLTNIFQGEIYVPSLLTDKLADVEGILEDKDAGLSPSSEDGEGDRQEFQTRLGGVQRYVRAQLKRAQHLHLIVQRRRIAPWQSLRREERFEPSFTQVYLVGHKEELPEIEIFPSSGRSTETLEALSWSADFREDFYRFLTYRSLGSVKRLRELVERQLRATDRAVGHCRWADSAFDCEHVLSFSDVDLFRIQITADIFRRLAYTLDIRMIFRDDKLAQGALYLSDFLLKFHGRAFSWGNLERVDELVHIHRAPELRKVLRGIVVSWSGPYLQIIRNGMYNYRFQSDFAEEIAYISRASEQELAAFNFTLDESQALKRLYRSRCEGADDLESWEFIGGLAELSEFDEEYEVARYEYRRAVRRLDESFNKDVSSLWDDPMSYRVMAGRDGGSEAARKLANWGIARVRLMLQIAMTYEATNDLEDAQVEYRNARTLAESVLGAMLERVDIEEGGQFWAESLKEYVASDPSESRYLGTLKHLNILFQPTFAEAWLAEKAVSGVDTGPVLVEQELWRLRLALPFVNPEDFVKLGSVTGSGLEHALKIGHSNFGLMLAELHNRAGDLYFIKGRQVVPSKLVPIWQARGTGSFSLSQGCEGFLLQARYHYALSLHEIRRFNIYRYVSSALKFNPRDEHHNANGDRVGVGDTIVKDGWTDFVSRLGAGGLADLAEAQIGLLSPVTLVAELKKHSAVDTKSDVDKFVRDALEAVECWLHGGEPETWKSVLEEYFPGREFRLGSLEKWFGVVPKLEKIRETKRLVRFPSKELPTECENFAVGLVFALVAAKLQEKGGYVEAAAGLHLRIADSVATVFWWLGVLEGLPCLLGNGDVEARSASWRAVLGAPKGDGEGDGDLPRASLVPFRDLGTYALQEAHRLTTQSQAHRLPRGEIERRELVLVGCSLSLALLMHIPDKPVEKGLLDLVGLGEIERDGNEVIRARLRDKLRGHLKRNSFPVLHRLRGLKVLVDDAVLGKRTPGDFAWISEDLKELLSFQERYGSRLHFTPLSLGITEALVALKGEGLRGVKEEGVDHLTPEPRELRSLATMHLQTSQQMYTMGRAYYESISDLYYLYDDFSDRAIHHNHAIQMAGSEVASVMLEVLRTPKPED